MLDRFIKYIRKEKLFKKDDQIVLAVSGGIDSMVMTELFNLAGLKFAIAHCNFGLRGKESDGDELFVKELAQKKMVRIFIKRFETEKYSAEQKISIQMAARKLRVDWFEDLIKESGFSYYATAHQLDDQIETFFINLFRGTGISGLHGILPKQGNLIHPLLFAYRKEIEEFAKANNLDHREDSSNLKTDYTRNKIRHKLIPVIKEINPDYAEIISKNISRLRQSEDIYRQQVRNISDKVLIIDKEAIKISISKLLELQPVETYLFELISPFYFNYSDVQDIINSLDSTSGKQFFSSTHRIIKDREYLIIEETVKKNNTIQPEYYISTNDSFINHPVKYRISRLTKPVNFVPSKETSIAFLDEDKLKFPLKIRKWKTGDYFYPFGMNKKKLLSDFFIDNKFTIPEKEKTWIITSGNQIVWIVGHRIDNRNRITESTQRVFRIELVD